MLYWKKDIILERVKGECVIMDNLQKIVVLIDADNTQLSKVEAVLHEVSTYGRIVVKKAYGNWQKATLKNWEAELKRLAIKAEQQFDYVAGKNATDIAMVIGAMDLLHTEIYDAVVLVSSDSDFTPLAIRLRESGIYIIGVGENKTPEAFRNSCDDFIVIEFLSGINTAVPGTKVAVAGNSSTMAISPNSNIDEVHSLLKIACERYQDDDGYVNVSTAGIYIKRAKPDFNPRIYGYTKLPEMLADFPEMYEMKRYKGKGTVIIVAYKCL